MHTTTLFSYSYLVLFLFLASPLTSPHSPKPGSESRPLDDITNSPPPSPEPTKIHKKDGRKPIVLTVQRGRRNAFHLTSPPPLYTPTTEECAAAGTPLTSVGAYASATGASGRISPVAAVTHSIPSAPPPPYTKPHRRIVALTLTEDDESKLEESAPAGAASGAAMHTGSRIRQLELNEKCWIGTIYAARECLKIIEKIDIQKKRARSHEDLTMLSELQIRKFWDLIKDFEERLMRAAPGKASTNEELEYYWNGCKMGVIGAMSDPFYEGSLHGLIFHEELRENESSCLEFLKKCTQEIARHAHPEAKLSISDITHRTLSSVEAQALNKQCMLYWTGCKCAFIGRMYEDVPLKMRNLSAQGEHDAQQIYSEKTFKETFKYCSTIIARYQKNIDECPEGFKPHPKTVALLSYWQGFQEKLSNMATLHKSITKTGVPISFVAPLEYP
jgi:hypothetical protein